MLVECQNCGAPLDVAERARRVKCNYCGHTNLVERTRTLSAVTPADWSAPKVWTPPSGASAPNRQLVYKAGGAIAGFTALMVMLPILLTCLIFGVVSTVVWQVTETVEGVTTQPMPGIAGGQVSWNGMAPLICNGNDIMTVTGVTANLPGATVVSASGNCRLTLVGCQITGTIGISAAHNAVVNVQGGSVTADPLAFEASGNARINVMGAAVTGASQSAMNAQINGVP